MKFKVTIVGAGLAGSEASLFLSNFSDFQIKLIEMRPNKTTEVHKTDKCAELVCSNSFKSLKFSSAAGMLKYEIASLGSNVFDSAINCRVEAGNALAVDRKLFCASITEKITDAKNINYVCDEFLDINKELLGCDALILATGPLTSNGLSDEIQKITGQDSLAFYDAAAPIVMSNSLNRDIIFSQDRYDESDCGDYLNAPLNKCEYENFINELLNAECVIKKNFESKDLFQACQPIEEVARSGFDAPRFGAMKPIGLDDPKTGKRPYAVVQLRSENKEKTSYNLVGFQTNLKFSEQKRVFKLIPGLENAEFVRYGVMHRNTFINAPKIIDKTLKLKNSDKNIYFAGQLSGTEGYLEAVRSGLHAAICVYTKLLEIENVSLSRNTAFGALIDYASNIDTKNYQPMHVNFGIMPPLEKQIRNKKERYNEFAKRGKIATDQYVQSLIAKEVLNDKALKLSKNLKLKLEKL